MAPESTAAANQDRRLHPMSWLFAFVTQLRQVFFPLLVLVFFGRGAWWEMFALLGAVALALYSLVYSFGFRYRIAQGELIVRVGIFDRTERHIPFERVQNIVQKQNLLHRLFGVTELRLESAGGLKPEAVMSVLKLADAQALEAILRRRSLAPANATVGVDPGASEDELLHALSFPEILRFGLISNRGMVVVASLMAIWFQFSDDRPDRFWKTFGHQLSAVLGDVTGQAASEVGRAGLLVAAVLLFLVLVRLLSIGLALLQFHGFRLTRHGHRLSTESGLISRFKASARQDRIQLLSIHASLLARWLNRVSVHVEVAGGTQSGDEQQRLKWLAPVATPAKSEQLLRDVLPDYRPETMSWRPLHPRAWVRKARFEVLFWLIVAANALVWTPWGLLLLLMPAWAVIAARGWARRSAYAIDDRVMVWRSGWLSQRTLVLPLDKVQVVAVKHSGFDRRAGMAHLDVDTMGGNAIGTHFEIPYLVHSEARALAAILGRRAARDSSSQAQQLARHDAESLREHARQMG